MNEIKLEDCKLLYERFKKYWEIAEQHQFPMLMMIELRLDKTIKNIDKVSQDELNSMFRVVSKIIGD
jgi:hypothetical protein